MSDRDGGSTQGMTMRQYYKAAALQGLCAQGRFGVDIVGLSQEAGYIADAALAEDAAFENKETTIP